MCQRLDQLALSTAATRSSTLVLLHALPPSPLFLGRHLSPTSAKLAKCHELRRRNGPTFREFVNGIVNIRRGSVLLSATLEVFLEGSLVCFGYIGDDLS